MRQREIVSFSIPSDGLRELKKAVSDSRVSLSQFLREAVVQKVRAVEWKRVRRKGAETARRFRVSPEDIETIVDEFRS